MTLPAATLRYPDALNRSTSRLVLVDLQEKLLAAMPDAREVVSVCRLLSDAADLFGVPVTLTEHYPRGLGATVPELTKSGSDIRTKLRFSAAESLAFPPASKPGVDRDQIVVAGLEAHICMAQTALDLLSLGYCVTVVADAVASRRPFDRDVALQRLRDVGVTVTTAEAVVFDWCETAEDPQFKALNQLVKQRGL